MKKTLLVVAAAALTVLITSNSTLFSRSIKPNDGISLLKNDQDKKVLGVEKDGIEWYKVENNDHLKLIPNFSEKLTANEVKQKYNCKFLTNGGFYTKDYRPIGLFIYNNKTLRNYMAATLTNAVFSLNDFATPRITKDTPRDNLQVALQNGPMLFDNGSKMALSIKNDKQSRRVVAATTGTNELVFISFYNPNSSFDGPFLEDVPNKLEEFEKESGIQIADAINLDGGAASAFLSEDISLTEATFVGSFFCEEN